MPEQTLVSIMVGLVCDRVRHAPRLSDAWGVTAAGVVLGLCGGGLTAWAWWTANDVLLDAPHRVVTEGPYAQMRHPMYLGWTAVHLGLGLVLRSPGVLVGVAPSSVLLHRQVLAEERALTRRLGPGYDGYRRAVPRYGLGGDRYRG